LGFLDFLRGVFGKGPERGVIELARRLGLSTEKLLAVEPSYRRFTIPKRSGERRRIAAPSPELRDLQRRILRRLLGRLRVHPAVHGFERGRSIVTNALPHARKEVVVRLDLRQFFASTSADTVERYFRRIGWDAKASRLLMIFCTLDGSLPQGAPTSPRLSNLVNFRLDSRLAALARKLGAVYTRYADDLTFSFEANDPSPIHGLLWYARQIVEEEGYQLHQKKKLQIRRRHDRQLVTGLVVNDRVNLPRMTRRWLRAVDHRLAGGRPATLTPAERAGWRSFASMVGRQSDGASGSGR